jgi:electron transport complex protein RnfE
LLGSIREILGSGSLFGVPVLGSHFEPWVIMILPPGGFITLGLLLAVFANMKQRRERAARTLAAPTPKRRVA